MALLEGKVHAMLWERGGAADEKNHVNTCVNLAISKSRDIPNQESLKLQCKQALAQVHNADLAGVSQNR
jgi:hypothetical protein